MRSPLSGLHVRVTRQDPPRNSLQVEQMSISQSRRSEPIFSEVSNCCNLQVGISSLLVACQKGFVEIVKILLEAKAYFSVSNSGLVDGVRFDFPLPQFHFTSS